MTFVVHKASDYMFREEKEINSLEDLKTYADKAYSNGANERTRRYKELIVSFDPNLITIYDDYIE